MAVTYTPNYNLAKYDAGDTGWDTGINGNFDTIDSTLADLQNQILADVLRADGTVSASADIDLGNNKLINLADPENDYDAVNKKYLTDNLTAEVPILSGDDSVYENNSTTNTIDNYNPNYTYSVSFSDPLLSGYIIGDTIYIDAGDITDGVDHTVTMTVTATPADNIGFSNSTDKVMTVLYLSLVADDAILLEGATYIEDNFDVIYDGSIS